MLLTLQDASHSQTVPYHPSDGLHSTPCNIRTSGLLHHLDLIPRQLACYPVIRYNPSHYNLHKIQSILMLHWLRSRFQVQRVQMDHDLLAIIEHWPNLSRQQRDRVKLLVIQASRSSVADESQHLRADMDSRTTDSTLSED